MVVKCGEWVFCVGILFGVDVDECFDDVFTDDDFLGSIRIGFYIYLPAYFVCMWM